ncbi:MAG: polymerase III subunit beta protein [Parcubacteria group bacterium GW2011_GWC2_39_14]|nr:MAG: polymerase III subunit beta protein [Parcubacteria group bacterium GW2011_GWC2_39_14]KKR55238.1 MAG: polymerase III subunit beta protein [Parcubacteria group bacterium GW2011_GWA2_40_23]
MKFTCLQENLNFGLQATGHLVNKNINLPILNNVLLEANSSGVKLSSTNLEIGISCHVRCKVDVEGAFTADARLLSEYISLLPNDQVNLELAKDDFLKVACRSSETKIKGIVSDDFPVIPKIERTSSYKINIKDFKKALAQVVFAVANSESRPEISGVLMSFNKIKPGMVHLVGTDSYRLTEKALAISDNKEERDVIVPVKSLQEVLRVLGLVKEQENQIDALQIFVSDNQILFSCDGIELISRLIEGQFPDYKQIIPTETRTQVVVATSELVKSIKAVALFSKLGIFDVNLKFNSAKGLIIEATNSQLGESKSEMAVAFAGEDNETTLNYRYLLDGLNNISAEEVELSLVDGNVPFLVRPKGDDSYTYIVMPIKQ